jgi:hypothetical protein
VRRDELLISSIAILGRGMVLLLLAHLSMVTAHWPAAGYDAVLALVALGTLGQAARMALVGPTARLTVPDWLAAGAPGGHSAGTALKSPIRLP